MRILSDRQLSLQPAASHPAGQVPQSRLVLNGNATPIRVDGTILEAAFQWNDLYLLFTTDDTPMEEMLRITLLDENLQALDKAVIGSMYSTGSFSLLPSDERSLVRFRFMGNTDWSVEILQEPGFRLPFLGDPRAVTRPLGFSRRFVVRGHPEPENN
ncbi:MAG: hypothetical protein ACN6PP_18650 [Delftia tsuruhatensis]